MSDSLKCKRNTDTNYPRVWLKFMAKDLNSDDLVEYRVEDLTEDRFDDAVDHLISFYARDEPMCKSKNVLSDIRSVATMRRLYRHTLNYKMGLVCYKENSNEIIGLNLTVVVFLKDKDTHPSEIKGSIFQELYLCTVFLNKQYNVYEEFGVDKYLSDYGLSVRPEYRGRNIGCYMLKAQVPLCKELGVTVTSSTYTAINSQVLAKKAGYETNYEITYDQLAELGWIFNDVETKSVKIMSLCIE